MDLHSLELPPIFPVQPGCGQKMILNRASGYCSPLRKTSQKRSFLQHRRIYIAGSWARATQKVLVPVL